MSCQPSCKVNARYPGALALKGCSLEMFHFTGACSLGIRLPDRVGSVHVHKNKHCSKTSVDYFFHGKLIRTMRTVGVLFHWPEPYVHSNVTQTTPEMNWWSQLIPQWTVAHVKKPVRLDMKWSFTPLSPSWGKCGDVTFAKNASHQQLQKQIEW